MGARKQADLTPEQYAVVDSLYDLQIEHWRDISLEAPRYLRIPGWPELYDHPRLSVFQTPDEIHKALAVCDDYIKAGRHYRVHRDLEHVWKILSSSARRSLRDRLEQRISSDDSSPSW